jgi:hypothetical protein
MPNKTNRKLIVGSEKLFQPNNILEQFSIDHDVLTFSYNDNLSLKANSKVLYKVLRSYLAKGYDKLVFMGHGIDCNLLYELYDDKALKFDAGVFVNYKQSSDGEVSLITQEHLFMETKIYSFSTQGNEKRPVAYLTDHQSLRTAFRTIRSKRLAQEIYGCVVYGAYQMNGLKGKPTAFVS